MKTILIISFLFFVGDTIKKDTTCIQQAKRIIENVQTESKIMKDLDQKNHKLDSIIAVLDSLKQAK